MQCYPIHIHLQEFTEVFKGDVVVDETGSQHVVLHNDTLQDISEVLVALLAKQLGIVED